MKRALQIAIAILLIIIAGVQLIFALGLHPNRAKQQVCPVDAIYMENGKAKIDSLKCIGCRRCVDGFLAIPTRQITDAPVADKESPELEAYAIPSEPDEVVQNTYVQPEAQAILQKPDHADGEERQSHTEEPAAADTKDFYIVDSQACITCNLCLKVCPVGAIGIRDGKAYIDPEKCINCGICGGEDRAKFRGCPVDAIHPATD